MIPKPDTVQRLAYEAAVSAKAHSLSDSLWAAFADFKPGAFEGDTFASDLDLCFATVEVFIRTYVEYGRDPKHLRDIIDTIERENADDSAG